MRTRQSLPLIAALLIAASPAAHAHHSFVGFYDQGRIVEIEGVVTAVSWRNPHGSLRIDVASADGETVEWQVETGSISVLRMRGLDRSLLEVGDRVRLAGEPALRRPNGLYARNVLLENGREALLSIGVEPRWTDPATGALLEPQFDAAAAHAARQEAEGIFRVWATVLEDPESFPMFKGGYPLTDAARAAKARWNASDVVQLGCAPKGMPALMITPYPIEIATRGEDIVIRFEEDDAERLIHMRPDAAAPPGFSSRLGFSTGRWDGATLVVETVAVAADYFDHEGTPQSPDARYVERFTPDATESRLDYRIEISDPSTFTATFALSRYFVWRPELTVEPYDCAVRSE